MPPSLIKIRTENSDFQHIETLRRNRLKRHKAGEFFVEGVRPITLAVQRGWQINSLVFVGGKRLSTWAEGVLAHAGARTLYELSVPLMDMLSQKEDPSELIALVAIPPDDLNRIPLRRNPMVLVLDRPVRPGNIGTILRSADALRADGLVITGHSADLYDPEAIRASTGSFFSVPSVRLPSHNELIPLIEALRKKAPGLQIVGTSAKAEQPIHQFDFTRPTVLLLGNETRGLSEAYREMSDALVTIPMDGDATSLNLASAASILLYEIDRQRRLASAPND